MRLPACSSWPAVSGWANWMTVHSGSSGRNGSPNCSIIPGSSDRNRRSIPMLLFGPAVWRRVCARASLSAMTLVPSLIAFVAAAAIVTVTPGMDTALVLRTAAIDGAKRGVAAAFGVGLGCLIWGASVALGLGALIPASHLAYQVVRWAVAAYLAWLRLRLLIHP